MKEREKKFDPGQIVATRGVLETMQRYEVFALYVENCLLRHLSGDWGDLDPKDAALNDKALESGEERIFSVYKYDKSIFSPFTYASIPDDGKIWIITEWDRSVTTILFPSEY